MAENGDTWAVADDGTVIRTINADGIDGLFDVSVVTYPAYTSTTVDMREILMRAATEGRLPAGAVAVPVVEPSLMAGPGSTSSSTPAGEDSEKHRRLVALRARAAAATATHQLIEEKAA